MSYSTTIITANSFPTYITNVETIEASKVTAIATSLAAYNAITIKLANAPILFGRDADGNYCFSVSSSIDSGLLSSIFAGLSFVSPPVDDTDISMVPSMSRYIFPGESGSTMEDVITAGNSSIG